MESQVLTKIKKIAEESDKVNESRKGSAEELASYYYKIRNHEDLFKTGNDFLTEMKKGIKNFAFTSTGYKNSQQKTMLGLCCYFDQNSSYKIAIISDHLYRGVFNDLVESSKIKFYEFEGEKRKVKYRSFYHHFDFIDYAEFAKFYDKNLYTKSFDSDISKIIDLYDIVFWDIPEIEKMKMNPHFYHRISHFYDSITMIVSHNLNSESQVESVKSFFSNYNINLNGVLFDTAVGSSPKQRKKFLGIF